MKDLFEQLLNDGESVLFRWKEEGFGETLYLDFKELGTRQKKQFTRDDRRLLGKALSGFSNAEGGIVIWGIKAKRDKREDIDKIQELKPFENFKWFESLIFDLASQNLTPTNNKLDIFSFPSSGDSKKGFVALKIGKGNRRPYMSLFDQKYYLRSGRSFLPMEHFQIEDMFRAQGSPVLKVGYFLKFGGVKSKPIPYPGIPSGYIPLSVAINITVENTSGIFANAPILSIKNIDGISSPNGKVRMRKPPLLVSETKTNYISPGFYEDDNSLHPGQVKMFQILNLKIGVGGDNSIWFFDHGENYRKAPEISITYDLSCKNLKKETGTLIISSEELWKKVWHFADDNHKEILQNFLR